MKYNTNNMYSSWTCGLPWQRDCSEKVYRHDEKLAKHLKRDVFGEIEQQLGVDLYWNIWKVLEGEI